jgi:hypothetical protein
MKHQFTLVLSVFFFTLLSSFASAQQATEPWNPPSITWFCGLQPAGETLCFLVARGPGPTTLQPPTEATAWIRILKGRTIGDGQTLLVSQIKLACGNVVAGTIECRSGNEVRLEPGVKPAYGTSPDTTTLNIYSDTPGPLFDWNGDGRITSDGEGIMLLRSLLGFRGAQVSAGISLTNGATADSAELAVYQGIQNGWFKLIAPTQAINATNEAIVFQRCALGLRGAALVTGVAGVDPAAVSAKCDALLAIQ